MSSRPGKPHDHSVAPATPIEIPARTWLVWGISLNLFLAFARILALRASMLDLLPDEAQYWSWSRQLDLGYFTKPPLIAWLIAATTSLFGNDEWGVRLAAPIIHAATGIVVCLIGRALFNPKVGFWAALLYATLPGVSFSALIISTDVPLLFFWALAVLATIRLIAEPGWRWAAVLGAALGFGMLSKYAMAFFILGLVGLPVLRVPVPWKELRAPLAAAAGVALTILAPNLVWNASHGWATVGHTGANFNWGGAGGLHLVEVAAFAGAQFGVFGPLLLGALIARLALWRRDPPTAAERLLLAFAVPVLGLMIVESGISRAHANWAAVSYVAGTVLIVGWLDRIERFWPVGTSLGLHVVLFAGLTLLFAGAIPNNLPKALDGFNQMRGWRNLSNLASQALLDLPPGSSLLAEDRQVMAELDYYLRARRFPLAMAVGTGKPGNQYELENAVDAKTGTRALLVARDANRQDILDRFADHSMLAEWTIRAGPGRLRHYYVFDVSGFRGN